MRRVLVISGLLALTPFIVQAADFDFVVSRGVWLSDKNALAGDKVKLYTVINNNDFVSLTTQVQFFNNGKQIGIVQVNNLVREEARQIALEYTLPDGKYTISVALANAVAQTANGQTRNLSEAELKASQTSAALDIDLDTDKDRTGNRVDPDDDNDGLTDAKETEQGTDPLKSDTDADGLSDSEENTAGTNPLKADSDGDGLTDKDEKARGTNPLKADTDGDGLDDGTEIKAGTSPTKADSDGDGLSDSEEKKRGTNPLQRDSDKDGVDDKEDLFPLNPNETTDHDGDGKGDNSDTDDDNDGQTDTVEKIQGTDPRVANPPPVIINTDTGTITVTQAATSSGQGSKKNGVNNPAETARQWLTLPIIAGIAAVFSLICSVAFWMQARRRETSPDGE